MVYVNRSVVVPTTNPIQLSVAVGAVSMLAEHSPVMVGSVALLATGAVTSFIITVWLCVNVLPLPSLYVQVTVCVPCVEYVNTSVVVPTTSPIQLSVAVGAVSILAEHSPVMVGSIVILATGAVTSFIITVWLCVDVLPLPSLYVQVTVCTP